ncbi:PHP domain-containing protein [Leucobacter salsicius]|uniref:PHP domain-containing protein n=1 Tax=Leucobacter salsicius TaxID=664638 RepID=UPI000349E37E|nr:PHP domain-containing protein [Leucobacter salsicius]
MALPLADVGYDLHTHSAFSDGTTSPTQIAAEAAAVGLLGFALTDHDTINGWGEARAGAAQHGVSFLPGIEITTKHRGHSRHLLGYGMNPAHGELFTALTQVRDARLVRVKEMVRRVSVDYAITLEDVVGTGDVATVGRPHIADALVVKGYFVDRSTAFEQVLHPGSPYYLGTYAIETGEAIRLVRAAEGVSVLAHPAAFRQRAATSVAHLAELAAAGLWGIELAHPENRGDWLPPLTAAAAELGLEVTGSSDYHGDGKPNRLGEHRTGVEVVERLRAIVATPH